MKRKVVLIDEALNDLNFWAANDTKMLKRIFKLITNIEATPFEGLGKPEALKENLHGYWSRRISDEHRIVYRIEDDAIFITSCRFHYKER